MIHYTSDRWSVFSPDSRLVIITSDDGCAQLWDARTAEPVGTPMRHKEPVFMVDFTADGRLVLTGSQYGNTRVWDTRTGEGIGPWMWIGTLPDLGDISPDGSRVLLPVDEKALGLWDPRTGTRIGRPIPCPQDGPRVRETAAFSPDGRLLLACSGAAAQLWETQTGDLVATLKGHEKPIRSAMFSHDGRLILTGSEDQTVRFWDVRTHQPVGAPIINYGAFISAEFSPDGKEVLSVSKSDGSGSRESRATLWDVSTGRTIGDELPGIDSQDDVDSSFSPDSRMVATANKDGVAKIWDVRAGRLLSVIRDPIRTAIGDVAFIAGGTCICAQSGHIEKPYNDSTEQFRGQRTFVADVEDIDTPQDIFTWPDADLERAVATECGVVKPQRVSNTFSLPLKSDGSVNVMESGNQVATLVGHGPAVRSAEFSPDGTRIVTAGDDRTIRFWDAETYRELIVFHTKEPVRRAQFTPDGERLVIDFADKTMEIWDPRGYAERQKDRDSRINERPVAREYVAKLLATATSTQPADLKKMIREDATITPLRKLVALEQLDIELRKRQREAE